MRNHRNQAGFTLAEVLVASAIFIVIIGAALTMYERSNRTFVAGVEAANVQQNTRIAFEKLASDVRMAGYDYDRDGIPTNAGESQQVDEQIEYIGRSAITIRGNFDFDSENTPCSGSVTDNCDNGRERAYESTHFPIVTTGNDEIATYALVSSAPGASNADHIRFWLDKARPRNVYLGGSSETQVDIDGVDLSNNNPPYRLERITINDDGTLTRTPVADNIRSLEFTYYEDTTGTRQLKDLATTPATIAPANYATAVGGGTAGFNPASPGDPLPDRLIRAKIQSVRVSLVGMNENIDQKFQDTTDTVAPHYRKYQLETLIVPRNFGRRGSKEQETKQPGSPTITRVCYGYCGLAYVEWTAPATNSNNGAPDQYAVLFDTVNTGSFANIDYRGNVLYAYVTLPDPTATYYFAVEAINSYGSAVSATTAGYSAKNATTPNPPTNLTATSGASALADKVTLTWKAPVASATGSISCSAGSPPAGIPTNEIYGWRVYRQSTYDTTWTQVANETTSSGAPTWNVLTNDVTFTDTTAANCVTYTYKVQTVERCLSASQNGSSVTGVSGDSSTATGAAASNATPAAPASLTPTGTFDVNGDYAITLTFPPVMADTSGNALNINHYVLYRTQTYTSLATNATVSTTLTNVDIYPNTTNSTWTPNKVSPTSIAYVDTEPTNVPSGVSAGQPYAYEYQLTAQQCSSPESAKSPIAKYPCPFGGGTITAGISPSSSVIEGAGTSASPWLIESSASSLQVVTASPINTVSATLRVGSGSAVSIGTAAGPLTTATFSIPAIASGSIGTISVQFTDSAGCVQNRVYYVSEAGTNCCLVPVSLQTSVRTIDLASKTVTYQLKNVCAETLAVSQIIIHWDSSLVGSGGKAIFYWPSALGQAAPSVTPDSNGTNSTTFTSVRPTSGTVSLIPVDATGTSDDYNVRVVFNKTISSNATNASPITAICVVYQRTGVDTSNRTCRIEPTPSPTVDTCP